MGRDIEALVHATLAGDHRAWQELWRAVEPKLLAAIRRPSFLGRLSESEDDCRNVGVEVMARLRDNDFARLGNFVDAQKDNPGLPFVAWLVVVAKRIAID
jgi:hypothetical protein